MQHRKNETAEEIIQFVNRFFDKNSRSPSLREIECGIHISRQTAYRYIKTMSEDGQLVYDGKSILTDHIRENSLCNSIKIPIVGRIPCGVPFQEEQGFEGIVSFPRGMLDPGQYYILFADGDSMKDAGIAPDDLVIIRMQTIANVGDIVVALNDQNETTLKRLRFDGSRLYLHPENNNYADYYPTELRIQGVAIKVIKNLYVNEGPYIYEK